MTASAPAVLIVDRLTVSLTSGVPVVEDISLTLEPGQILGLVGESGCGKSTLALALLGYSRPGAQITGGSVEVSGEQMVGRSTRATRALRGRTVAYVPQDPASSLNPSRRIERQLSDRIRDLPAQQRADAIRCALERAQLPVTDLFMRRFPHQLSGGQQQRTTVAMAIIGNAPLIVLDEPTTGLDVVTQSHLLREIARLRDELGIAMIYVSHDIAAVASIADSVAVMYAGRIVEQGPVERVLREPAHPYTCGLIASVPDPSVALRLGALPGVAAGVGEWPQGCPFAPRCDQASAECAERMPDPELASSEHMVRCFHWRATPPVERRLAGARAAAAGNDVLTVEHLRAVHRSRHEEVVAAQDISFSVRSGECVALVGESGSGKTTIARCIAGLHPPAGGTIALAGEPLAALAGRRDRAARRRIQIIFQNPYESLNPRHRISRSVMRPAQILLGLSAPEAEREMLLALERVRLPGAIAARFPGELSGGERQRVAIARALAARPDLLVCDEITSALDVSVQGAVLDLLADLRAQLGLAILFITHDLGVVASAADRILVLERGTLCETGPVHAVLVKPTQPYTRQLVEAAPRLDHRVGGAGDTDAVGLP